MDSTTPLSRRVVRPLALAVACAGLALTAAPALAGSGGIGGPGSGGGGGNGGPAGKAQLKNGLAVPPSNAPRRVEQVINAANKIAKGKDYCYGGGHGSFNDNCYDCSGAVSYALHGGDFLDSPMPSGSFRSWGKRGKGKWITVYAHSDHAVRRNRWAKIRYVDDVWRGPGMEQGHAIVLGILLPSPEQLLAPDPHPALGNAPGSLHPPRPGGYYFQ